MGVNNKQRRAAKQRKRASQRAGRPGPTPGQDWQEAAAYGSVELRVTAAVRRLGRHKYDEEGLLSRTETLLRSIQPQPRQVAELVLADLLRRLADGVRQGGWDDPDLEQLVRRCADDSHLPMLTAVSGNGRLRLDSTERFASGLQVAALLATVPLLDADSFPDRGGGDDRRGAHPKLAQVRALLAKAESTDYDEEAEALTAKAQELITRYALTQLVDSVGGGKRTGGGDVQMRRIWLDAPYLRAKAALVHEVADANRCRSASAEAFGFCLVVGSPADLDAVELLVTSLLVQAARALLRHGRLVDRGGRSRTRSFRQSFLVAYAVRIGERLRVASDAAVTGDSERLLPVLRDHEETVAEAFDAMVPHTVGRSTNVTSGEGWAAGVVAADLALLDVNGKLPGERAG